jgi:hypothetical protein
MSELDPVAEVNVCEHELLEDWEQRHRSRVRSPTSRAFETQDWRQTAGKMPFDTLRLT